MPYYTNYKQVAKVVLKNIDANIASVTNTDLGVIVITEYIFKVNLPTLNFNKQTKMAVESFSIIHTIPQYNGKECNVGDVYIKNLTNNDVYHSANKHKGLPILSMDLGKNNQYNNTDLINNSYDITGKTMFLKNEFLHIFVDTGIKAGAGNNDINGCPLNSHWTLSLIIYEYELEENKKDFVSKYA